MTGTFSEDDVGKTLENADGMAVGNVASVEGNTAEVDTDPGLGDSIKAALGWETDTDRPTRIDASDVAEVTDDAVRLEATESGERDVGPTSGEIGGTSTPRDEESSSEEDDVEDGERPPEGDRTVTRERGTEDGD